MGAGLARSRCWWAARPVGEEHEQVLPAGLDRALQLVAERMGRHTPQQVVKPGLELAGVAAQRRVGQIRAACSDPAGALEKLLQAGSEGGVAGLDSIPCLADQMGK